MDTVGVDDHAAAQDRFYKLTQIGNEVRTPLAVGAHGCVKLPESIAQPPPPRRVAVGDVTQYLILLGSELDPALLPAIL